MHPSHVRFADATDDSAADGGGAGAGFDGFASDFDMGGDTYEIPWRRSAAGGVDDGDGGVMGDWRSYVGTSILNTWNWNAMPNQGFVQRIVDITEID